MYQFQGMIGTRDKEPADLDVHLIWRYFGHKVGRDDLERDPDSAPVQEDAAAAVVSETEPKSESESASVSVSVSTAVQGEKSAVAV